MAAVCFMFIFHFVLALGLIHYKRYKKSNIIYDKFYLREIIRSYKTPFNKKLFKTNSKNADLGYEL